MFPGKSNQSLQSHSSPRAVGMGHAENNTYTQSFTHSNAGILSLFRHPQLAHGASPKKKKKKTVWDLCDNLTLNMLAYVDNLRYKTGVFKLDPGSHKGLKVVFVL